MIMKIFYTFATIFFALFLLRSLYVYENNWLAVACLLLLLASFFGYLYSKEIEK